MHVQIPSCTSAGADSGRGGGVALTNAFLACRVRIGFYKAICEVLRVGQCTELVIGLVGGGLVFGGGDGRIAGCVAFRALRRTCSSTEVTLCSTRRHAQLLLCDMGHATSLLWQTHATHHTSHVHHSCTAIS